MLNNLKQKLKKIQIYPKVGFLLRSKEVAGFTLMELLLVVVLISVLSGMIISAMNVGALRIRSRDAQRSADLKKVQAALELYYSDFRSYPPSGSFQNITTPLSGLTTGSYISVLPSDPRNGENIGSIQCSQTVYRYYYRTDAAAVPASRYVLFALMESTAGASPSVCNTLPNCLGASPAVAGCSCGTVCYGVQNPF